jgi:hypothetical protein
MKKPLLRRLLLICAVALVAIQFIRPAKNAAPGPFPDDLFAKYSAPPEVRRTVEQACYDCHSDNTRYPWYAAVQPVGWWLAYHVNDGKGQLNFSHFGAYATKRAARKLGALGDEVEQGGMPLRSYTWMHPEARLTAAQRKQIVDWASALQDQLAPE